MATTEQQSNENEDLIDTILEQKKSDDDINKQLAAEALALLAEEDKKNENELQINANFIISKYDQEKNKFISLYDEFNLENQESIDKFNSIKPLIDNNKDIFILPKKDFNDFNDFKIYLIDLLPKIQEYHDKLNISPPNLNSFDSNLKIEKDIKEQEAKKNDDFIANKDSITPPETPKPSEIQAKFSNVNKLISSLEEEKRYFKPLDSKFTKRDALISGISVFVGLSVSSSLIVGGIVGFGIYKLARKFFPEQNKDIKSLNAQILLLKEAANSVLAKNMVENNPSLNYEKTFENLMKNPKNTDIEFNKDIQDRFLDLTQAHNIEFNRKVFMEVRHRFNAQKSLSNKKPQ